MKRYSINQSFLLSDEEMTPLEQAANDRRCSKSFILRELIRQNLQNADSTKDSFADFVTLDKSVNFNLVA